MLEYLADPPWWFVAIITLAVPEAFRWLKKQFPTWSEHAKGALRRRLRAWQCRQLLVIKRQRFDSAIINRIVVRSYAYLMLFVSCALVYFMGLLLVPEALRQNQGGATVWGIVAGAPMIAFELAWLSTSMRVDELLRFRRRIKSREGRLR
ncbi:hypothetical protein [Pseudomonas saudiphocaensis]|uniref:hypothetical protein n=1 Tax=Pseudomonas saudiphocaensis TaxID=1499686 RepID=UPI000F77652B|nr:hypothetical protein [Pseudomonas saudiphocaensis]RRV18126.1 hypothetical protein EGJ00_02025 [Pseudomonas saudiphocaensis]